MSKEKIILAYSGGLDTSIAIPWLQDKYQYEVIAVAADIGEKKDWKAIKSKALNLGALKCYILPLQKTFAMEYLSWALKANACYESAYFLNSALSRPLIAQKFVEIAHKEKASAIAHGCTGKGNDQVRFDVSINTLDPNLNIIAPVRDFPMSREKAIEYATKHDIPLPINLNNPFSIDENLWGRSCECGILEDPWIEPPEQAYAWTKPLNKTPNKPEYLEISFEKGLPIAFNGQVNDFDKLITCLNQKAGEHGIGRIDHVENRLIGIKSREIYESPAAVVLTKAHQALESLCLTSDVQHFKPLIEQKFTQLVYNGLWFSPLRKSINAFIDETQQTVNGIVRMKLFKGHAVVVGRQSPQSLYQKKLATYQDEDMFDHNASKGFIKIFGLSSKVNAFVNY